MEYVFTNRSITDEELKKRIQVSITYISEDTFQKVLNNSEFRFRLLLRQNVTYFEIPYAE